MDYNDEDDGGAGFLNPIVQKEKEELEFYTDLAVQEMQRWIEAVTRKKFKYPDDPKQSLSDGVLLCELLNNIKPGTVKRINRLPTAMAGMDNLNVFIEACKRHFGLKEAQLFTPTDLQDFSERHRDVELSLAELKEADDKKIRNVAIAVFWLARQVQAHVSTQLDFTNFTALVNAKSLGGSPYGHQHQYSSSSDFTEPDLQHYRHSRTSSRDSTDDMSRRSSTARREGRYSSSDSLDDYAKKDKKRINGFGSHSSDRSGMRRTSSAQPAKDPLQFIASKPALDLAQTAEKQLKLTQETKKRRESETKDEAEWQFVDDSWKADLSSWKQRRKSTRKSGVILPEREANEIQSDTYLQFERAHTDLTDGGHYSQSQSSQSYDDDDTFYSQPSHQKSGSDLSSTKDGVSSNGVRSFQSNQQDITPVSDVMERVSAKMSESQPLQSSGVISTSGSVLGKSKLRLKLVTQPGSDDGFGFSIKGGKDKCLAITVESVVNDSPADKAELMEGDEVLEINDEVVSDRNRGYCMLLVNGSLQKNGTLDLYIRRDYSKVAALSKDRKQSSNVAPKSILDIYQSMEAKQNEENIAESVTDEKMEKMDEDLTQKEMEREYRQILDGGYDSAVSTLRSEFNLEDRQPDGESQTGKVTVTAVHASYMNSPSDYLSPQEYEERDSEGSEDKCASPTPDQEEDMGTFEQIEEKVVRDFEQLPPRIENNSKPEKRSQKVDKDSRQRMEEWQRQQELRQQEQFEKEQQKIQRDIEESRKQAEEYELNRQAITDSTPPADEGPKSKLSSLRQGISAVQEKEARDKTVQKLLEIKARYSAPAPTNTTDERSPAEVSSPTQDVSGSDDDDLAQYRISSPIKEKSAKEMRDTYAASYMHYKPAEEVAPAPKQTPYLSDVYKYYEEDLPSNLGERDPTPPPMSRKDVMNMNKKSTPWQDAKEAGGDRPWERKEVIAPVNEPAVQTRVNRQTPRDDRRKSAPVRHEWKFEDTSGGNKESDVDPNLPSTLRKEDVLKMTREKARFSQSKRMSSVLPQSQPINLKTMNAVPVPVRKDSFNWIRLQPECATRKGEEESNNKSEQRKSMGFFSNRAMFEQQSREADRYWADQNKEQRKSQPAKNKVVRKAASTVDPPMLMKDNRSKSVDIRPRQQMGDVVRSVAASDAAYERMKELAEMKKLREAEAAKAEEDERERRNKERKLRDERQRELAQIRKMNQQYEAESYEQNRQQSDQRRDGPSSRSDELERARQRMAREAEELAKAQRRHDQDIKNTHGLDMSEERRRRELDHQQYDKSMVELDRVEEARRAQQELIDASRRDEERRKEAARMQRLDQPSQPPTTRQQLEQQEWRPQQHQRPYVSQAPPTISSNGSEADKYHANRHLHMDSNNGNNYGVPPNQYSGGDAPSDPRMSKSSRDEVGEPLDSRNALNSRGMANVKESSPPLYQPGVKSQQNEPSTRQQPIGRTVNSLPQDPYNRDIPKINNSPSYERGQGYPTNNDVYGDRHSYGNHTRPQVNQQKGDSEHHISKQTNGTPPAYSSNEVNKGGMYPRQGATEPANAPSKPPRKAQRDQDDLLTVSAKYSCAYCSKELGKGAAMVIESLGLYYHVGCFRCCVCHSLLSNGQMGADVRVRVNRLHCKNCYSNDDAGIKYSAV